MTDYLAKHPIAFVERVVGTKLLPWQKQLLRLLRHGKPKISLANNSVRLAELVGYEKGRKDWEK